MSFQRARNDEQRQVRLDQITNAMIELMQDLPFDKITMKKLGEKLSFTRNNLYQYVKSKNEIIILIIQRDFKAWYTTLKTNLGEQQFSENEFIKIWVEIASQYPRILHWFPLLGELIEKDVSLEKLIPFKKNFYDVMQNTEILIIKCLPELTMKQAEHLIYFHLRILPHLFHLYHQSDIQQKAVKEAGYPAMHRTFAENAALEMQIYLNGLKNTTESRGN